MFISKEKIYFQIVYRPLIIAFASFALFLNACSQETDTNDRHLFEGQIAPLLEGMK